MEDEIHQDSNMFREDAEAGKKEDNISPVSDIILDSVLIVLSIAVYFVTRGMILDYGSEMGSLVFLAYVLIAGIAVLVVMSAFAIAENVRYVLDVRRKKRTEVVNVVIEGSDVQNPLKLEDASSQASAASDLSSVSEATGMSETQADYVASEDDSNLGKFSGPIEGVSEESVVSDAEGKSEDVSEENMSESAEGSEDVQLQSEGPNTSGAQKDASENAGQAEDLRNKEAVSEDAKKSEGVQEEENPEDSGIQEETNASEDIQDSENIGGDSEKAEAVRGSQTQEKTTSEGMEESEKKIPSKSGGSQKKSGKIDKYSGMKPEEYLMTDEYLNEVLRQFH